MYDIKPLEDEWNRYKKKKMKPWYLLVATLLLVLVATLFTLNYKDLIVSKWSNLDNNESQIVNKSKKSILLLDKALTTLEVKSETVKKDVSENSFEEKSEQSSTVDDPMRYQHPNAKKVFIQVSEPIKKSVVNNKPRKRKHLNIIQTTSKMAYRDVEKRFSDTQDIDDSLFLARTYYNKGNNKKAIFWALQTNKINPNVEESWIIFAKAKARSGHKSEAVRILSSYVERSNSYSARVLLRKYKK